MNWLDILLLHLMKLIHALFGFLISLLLLMGICFFLPDAYTATSAAHPLDPSPASASLLQSTGSLADSPHGLWLGYFMVLLILGVMGSCTLLGVSKKNQVGPYLPWLSGAFVALALIFTGLTYSYSFYTESHTAAFFGGYPAPTAWMIYGVWLFPLVIIGLFIYTFDSWFLKPADLASFRELVKSSAGEKGEII